MRQPVRLSPTSYANHFPMLFLLFSHSSPIHLCVQRVFRRVEACHRWLPPLPTAEDCLLGSLDCAGELMRFATTRGDDVAREARKFLFDYEMSIHRLIAAPPATGGVAADGDSAAADGGAGGGGSGAGGGGARGGSSYFDTSLYAKCKVLQQSLEKIEKTLVISILRERERELLENA